MLRHRHILTKLRGPLNTRFASQSKVREKPGPTKVNHYETLGLLPDATNTEIREAFFKKAKELHPDVNPSPDAREKFQKVHEAFKALKDKSKRQEYDRKHDFFVKDIQSKVS